MTIPESEDCFRNAPKPDMPVFLDAATNFNDHDHFPDSHFAPLRKIPDSKVNQSLLWRLEEMKVVIDSNL